MLLKSTHVGGQAAPEKAQMGQVPPYQPFTNGERSISKATLHPVKIKTQNSNHARDALRGAVVHQGHRLTSGFAVLIVCVSYL